MAHCPIKQNAQRPAQADDIADHATAVDFEQGQIVFWFRPAKGMGREHVRLVILFHRVRGHWSEAGGLVTRVRRPPQAAAADDPAGQGAMLD